MSRHGSHMARTAALRFALVATLSIAAVTGVNAVSPSAFAETTPTPDPSITADVTASPTPTVDPTVLPTSAPVPDPSPTDAPTTPATVGPSPATVSETPAPVVPGTPLPDPVTPRLTTAALTAAATTFTSPHGPYTTSSDQCATCHRAHTAQSDALLRTAAPQSVLCFTCHDGTGATTNVAADYTSSSVPLNVPSTPSSTGTVSAYYRHDANVASAHELGGEDEFGGVSNRHAACGDCHDPHRAAPVDTVIPAPGVAWPLSARTAGASGVAVTNGAAGSAPTYTFLSGSATAPVQFEYQLCLKCHSGWTTLKSNAGVSPSSQVLDAGIEFNPNNNSFHPVEAAGTNATAAMTASLTGGSPYKLWNFSVGDTVRCTHCHANGLDYLKPSAENVDNAPHVSPNRGILLQNYRDREGMALSESYSDADFALCFMCHTNAPFATDSSTATNFKFHNKHMAGIPDKGSGSQNIDDPTGGQGNAICAECHYRLHSTATTPGQYSRLVSFAPDVAAVNGVLNWTSTGTGSGSCTLRCHGYTHNAKPYTAP